MSVKASLGLLRERNFGWYFWSRFVNLAGSSMASVAAAFAVLSVSDSASALGQVLAARMIPMVIFLLVGGVIADRFPRVLVLQLSNILSALTQGTVAYLVISGRAEIWMLICLELANGTASAVSMPAMQGLIPQLVSRERLQPANVLLSMSRGTLTIAGPSISAVLVADAGAGWALAVDACTWLAAALLMLPVRIPPRATAQIASGGMVADLREGWVLFRTTTWLWVVVVAFGVLNAMHTGALQTLGPVIAKQHDSLGVRGWGFANSAESVGLLAMTFLLLRLRLRYPLRAGMWGISALALPMLVLGLFPETVPLVIAMAAAGACTEIFSLGWNLAMMENISEEMMSRAASYDMLGSFVAMPVGQLLYGPLGEWFGYRLVLVASGVLYAAICLATVAVPAVRNLPRRDDTETDPQPESPSDPKGAPA